MLRIFRPKDLFCRNYLVPDDFLGFLPPDKAAAAFHYIDDNDSGRVAQSELLNAVVQIFRWGFCGLGSERQAPWRAAASAAPGSNGGRLAHCDAANHCFRELISLAGGGCLS